MANEKIHLYRLIPILVMAGVTAVLSILLCLINELYRDEELCILFLDILFFLVLVFELEYDRRKKQIAGNGATTFSRIAGGYAASCLILLLFVFLPEFYCPVLLIPVLMCGVSNEMISMSVSLFLVLEFSITAGGNYFELVCYCILILVGVILAKTMEEKKYRYFAAVILFCISIFVPAMFYTFSSGKTPYVEYIYGAVSGGVTVLFSLLYYGKIREATMAEQNNRLLDIVAEDFIVVRELKSYSPSEYAHAKRVSELSARCGKILGFQENLCAAAGFYYRIGRWQGEPYVLNGIKRAEQLCFPVELTAIISEYYGEEYLPTTPESALIHMVDALTIKLDALKQDVKGSAWNTEMIIYQTLNEYSSFGLYDRSGMSMNQFLKVRDILTKEKWDG
jgi:hypothetical protein